MATSLPNLKRAATCVAVNVRTFLVVFLARSMLFLLESLISTGFFAGFTFLEKNPPRLSNPFEIIFPVYTRPFPSYFDAPTKIDLSSSPSSFDPLTIFYFSTFASSSVTLLFLTTLSL